jgi:hypothetical protein
VVEDEYIAPEGAGLPPPLPEDFFETGGFSDMNPEEPLDGSRAVTYTKPADYDELLQWYQELEQEYPNYLRVWKLNEDYGLGQIPNGAGGADYDYWMVRLTNESNGFHKPEALFLGTPHGDEIAGPIGQYWFANWTLRHARTDDYNLQGDGDDWLNWILDNREIYMAVNHNPDGFTRLRRFDANNHDLNRRTDYDFHSSAAMSCPNTAGQNPWDDVNGQVVREFVNDHQFRVGTDFHAGVRMLLYAWGLHHSTISGLSKKTSVRYYYAPPDFYYLDIQALRLGDFMGNYGGSLDSSNTGPPADILYSVCGSWLDWGYGGDVDTNPSEDAWVDDEVYGNYDGAGILWMSPEMSTQKVVSENSLGGDNQAGFGPEVRRFILHQTDLAQPYIWIPPTSVENNSLVEAGEEIDFHWKVNGALVVDHTYIQWGTDPDPINNYDNQTSDHDDWEGKYYGGTGWENANSGTHTGYTHTEKITAPEEPGDYYFVIKAQVDQAYKDPIAQTTYGDTSYLRLVKERTDADFTETLNNGADGTETIKGQLWWWSNIFKITVKKTPHVISTNPVDGADMVPTTTSISVEFDTVMDHPAAEGAFSTSPSETGTFTWDGDTMTFKPDAELQKTTEYTVTIGTGAKSIIGAALEEEYSFSFTTALSGDVEPPAVIRTDPEDGQQDVPTGTSITIEFNETMDQPSCQGAFSTLPTISGSFNWTNESTMVFIPDEALEGDTDYIVNIGTSATDTSKNALPALYSFDFRTGKGDVEPPTVEATVPYNEATNVSVGTTIEITFSESMDEASATTALTTLPPTTGSFSWDLNTMIFKPGSLLRPETLYQVTVGATAADISGNHLAGAYVFTFTTRDTMAPEIINVDPPNEAAHVPLNKEVTVTFSEPMEELTAEAAFALDPASTGTFEWMDNNMTVTPDEPYEPHTLYRLNVSTLASDRSGNGLTSNFTSVFTTGGQVDNEPPTVKETFPPRGMVDVSPFSYLTIKFSEPMESASITQQSINVLPEPLKGGIIGFNVDTMRFEPNPISPGEPGLLENTKYTVTVTTHCKDLAGNPMKENYVFTFTTGMTTVPTILRTDPLNGDVNVPLSTDIEITFSKEMNLTTVESAFSISPQVTGEFSMLKGNITVVFTPDKPLKKATTYTFKVNKQAKDMSGNSLLSEESFSFLTEGKKDVQQTGLEGNFSLLLLILAIVIVAVVAITMGAYLHRRRKKKADAQISQMAALPPGPGPGEPGLPPQPPPTTEPAPYTPYGQYDQPPGEGGQTQADVIPQSTYDWNAPAETEPAAPPTDSSSPVQETAPEPAPTPSPEPAPAPPPAEATATAAPAEAPKAEAPKKDTGVSDIDDIINALQDE